MGIDEWLLSRWCDMVMITNLQINNITIIEKLLTKMLLYLFELIVCRRWREIGKLQRLCSFLPVMVNTRNVFMIAEILSTRRMLRLKKFRIKAFAELTL